MGGHSRASNFYCLLFVYFLIDFFTRSCGFPTDRVRGLSYVPVTVSYLCIGFCLLFFVSWFSSHALRHETGPGQVGFCKIDDSGCRKSSLKKKRRR